MPKLSEILDTPEAFSRAGETKKNLRICNRIGVHTCRLGSIHLNEREALILNDYLTTKDQEKEEAIRAERKKIIEFINSGHPEQFADTGWSINLNDVEEFIKALPTEDNN